MSTRGSEPPSNTAPTAKKTNKRGGLFWFSVVVGALLLFIAATLAVLLYTEMGRDIALKQIAAHLPENMTLNWKRAEGTLAGNLRLYEAQFQHDAVAIDAQELSLRLDFPALLQRTVHLQHFHVTNAQLVIASSTADTVPFEWPRWPEMLPVIDLPLTIQADDIQITALHIRKRVLGRAVPLITIRRAHGGLGLMDGGIETRQLVIRSNLGHFTLDGHYRPKQHYRTDIQLRATLPAEWAGSLSSSPVIPLGLVARGDQSHFELAVVADFQQRQRLYLHIDEQQRPQWQLQLDANALDLSQWLPQMETPLSVMMQASGQGNTLEMQGSVQTTEQIWPLHTARFVLEDQAIAIETLEFEVFEGAVQLQGVLDLADLNAPQAELQASINQLHWNGLQVSQAQIQAQGGLESWQASGQLQLQHEAQQAQIQLAVQGDRQQIYIEQLLALTPEGSLAATGMLAWDPILRWQADIALANFDPGHFLPGWNGRLFGTLRTEGQQPANAPLQAQLLVSQLQGPLRGQPLAAQAQLQLTGQSGQGNAAIRWGDNHVQGRGRFGPQSHLNVEAEIQALNVADFGVGSGHIQGHLALQGTLKRPDIQLDLKANHLQWQDFRAERLEISGSLPWQAGDGALQLQAWELETGITVQQVQIAARGHLHDFVANWVTCCWQAKYGARKTMYKAS